MADFPRIDPTGKTDRELMEALVGGIEATHACIDGFREDQARVNAEAAKKRHAMTSAIVGLQGGFKRLTGDIAALKYDQGVDSGRLDKLTKALGVEKVEKGEKRPTGHGLATWGGWKLFGAVGGLLTLVVFAYQFAVAIAPAAHHYLMSLKP